MEVPDAATVVNVTFTPTFSKPLLKDYDPPMYPPLQFTLPKPLPIPPTDISPVPTAPSTDSNGPWLSFDKDKPHGMSTFQHQSIQRPFMALAHRKLAIVEEHSWKCQTRPPL